MRVKRKEGGRDKENEGENEVLERDGIPPYPNIKPFLNFP